MLPGQDATPKAREEAKRLIASIAGGDWYTLAHALDAFAQSESQRLRAALTAVRVRALPAGASIVLHREGWEARCCKMLDIIDEALAGSEPQRRADK